MKPSTDTIGTGHLSKKTIPERKAARATRAPQTVTRETVSAESETSYAAQEYGVTEKELTTYVKRVHAKIEKARKEGKLHEFTGDIEALCEGDS